MNDEGANWIEGIKEGSYDNDLSGILDAIEERRNVLRREMLAKVKDLFGPDAEVVVGGKANPFVKLAQEEPARGSSWGAGVEGKPEPMYENEPDEPVKDPLAPREQELNRGQEPGIESRGAIIGGVSSSDIAE